MTLFQQMITIGLCIAGTMLTRFLPFFVFNENRKTPDFVKYIGKFLPPAVFGLLIIYCVRNVDFLHASHGLPELLSILTTAGIHLWKRQMLLSIAAGTICYMLLLRLGI